MPGVTDAKLVRNESPDNHLDALRAVLRSASEIYVAVAFLRSKGLHLIIEDIRSRLAAKAKIEMFVGRDFCLTEPKALGELLALSKRQPSLKVFVAKADPRSTFHPKLYLGISANEARVLMGSANLTGGALMANDEISLSWALDPNDALVAQLRNVFVDYKAARRFEELDEAVLGQYRLKFKEAEEAKRRIEKEIAAADDGTFDLETLTSLHEEFTHDRAEMAALEKRRSDRKRAKTVQRQIAAFDTSSPLALGDRKKFTSLFRDLVTSGDGHRHLWHSGDIHRRGQDALKQPEKTIALFSLGAEAAKLPPQEGYALMRGPAKDVPGVGINMVSEILCTFAPTRYAVFNGNTAAALRVIGAEPSKSITLFSSETYGRICGIVEAVRRRIGGKDLSDADAFLNWIYQTKVKNAHP